MKQVVYLKDDSIGIQAFAAIKAKIMDHKLSKDHERRFEKIDAVFSYRADLAIKLEATTENYYPNWERNKLQERLNNFKPVKFFLDAAQHLLEDIEKEEAGVLAAKMAKKKPIQRWG